MGTAEILLALITGDSEREADTIRICGAGMFTSPKRPVQFKLIRAANVFKGTIKLFRHLH